MTIILFLIFLIFVILSNNQTLVFARPKRTAKPTARPTIKPTASPTTNPTISPTASPTIKPTASPTISPTTKPTASPTVSPTAKPTASPTVSPTANPTISPTANPTFVNATNAPINKQLTYYQVTLNVTIIPTDNTYFFEVIGYSFDFNRITYNIGKCNNTINLSSSFQYYKYSVNYTYETLHNSCNFMLTNNLLYGKIIIANPFYQTIFNVIFTLNSNIEIVVENVKKTENIPVVYPSILSYRGTNYNKSIAKINTVGLTTACFRQTIFGAGNSLKINDNCSQSFMLTMHCDNTKIDLSKYPCAFNNADKVTEIYQNDGTYVIEYCVVFSDTIFSEKCVGSYESKLNLVPRYLTQYESNYEMHTTSHNVKILDNYSTISDRVSYLIIVFVCVSYFFMCVLFLKN